MNSLSVRTPCLQGPLVCRDPLYVKVPCLQGLLICKGRLSVGATFCGGPLSAWAPCMPVWGHLPVYNVGVLACNGPLSVGAPCGLACISCRGPLSIGVPYLLKLQSVYRGPLFVGAHNCLQGPLMVYRGPLSAWAPCLEPVSQGS